MLIFGTVVHLEKEQDKFVGHGRCLFLAEGESKIRKTISNNK